MSFSRIFLFFLPEKQKKASRKLISTSEQCADSAGQNTQLLLNSFLVFAHPPSSFNLKIFAILYFVLYFFIIKYFPCSANLAVIQKYDLK